jgi:hypothetical protein
VKKDLKTLLTDEIVELSKKQSAALETAAYLTMSKAEATAFDARCDRMEKIRQLLGHPSDD